MGKNQNLSRRRFLQGAAVASVAVASGGRLAFAAAKSIKIGYVSPKTGPLAPFAVADQFVIDEISKRFADGIAIAGVQTPVEILVRDSQSKPSRAAEVAASLIKDDAVDLILVSSTPETTNPVSDQCELNEVPCISTVAPWQPWFFTRGGKPETGFNWTYHFFWGLEDIIGVFDAMWASVPTNKVIGGLWPNDGDGNAWSDPKIGFPSVLLKEGYKIVDPGRYQDLTDDFSAQISAFKDGNVEIVTGVPIPPDFTTFWRQAGQRGFKPKVATVGKALLFPSSVEALGPAGAGLSSEVWWTPNHPFKSSLDGRAAKDLAEAFEKGTGKQWTQPLGFSHALLEVAADVLKRSKGADNASIRDALASTDLNTIVGPVKFGGKGPFKNVSKTPLVGGQWRKGTKYPFDLIVVSNTLAPQIPAQGKLELL
jgi:branched-chain amino acid transport system substrate-binding protein